MSHPKPNKGSIREAANLSTQAEHGSYSPAHVKGFQNGVAWHVLLCGIAKENARSAGSKVLPGQMKFPLMKFERAMNPVLEEENLVIERKNIDNFLNPIQDEDHNAIKGDD